jgi:gas vesicle protein
MINKKDMLIGTALGLIVGCSGALMAQAPVVNIGDRHGNLRAAQQYIVNAWQRIDNAQVDNNYNLGGHAGRAKDLLVQADEELRLAANTANQHER